VVGITALLNNMYGNTPYLTRVIVSSNAKARLSEVVRQARQRGPSLSHCTFVMPSSWFGRMNSIACGGLFPVAIS